MSTYYLLIPNVESEWDAKSDADKQVMYDTHATFRKALADRGHHITGGAELAAQSSAVTVRGDEVTQGPYAEAGEHLAGLYVVDTDDLDDLVDAVKILTTAESCVEIRAEVRS
jgi:hypothetical protein